MNYDGASIRSAVKIQSLPIFVAEMDISYPLGEINVSLPAYKNSDRVLLQRCVLAVRLQYRFTSAPILFTLEIRDIRTDTVVGSSPYGQEDFSTEWNTMSEDYMLDEFDSRYIQINLLMSADNDQRFIIRRRSFYSVNTI